MIFLTRVGKTSTRLWLSIVATLALCLVANNFALLPCQAAGPKDQGIAAYKTGDVRTASSLFETALKSNPADASAHYWLGLCYQRMNRTAEAKQQYSWVTGHTADAALKGNAQSGLSQLTKLASSHGASASAPIARASGGKPKVIEFSAVWCGPCKRFKPTFDKVSAQYASQVTFQSVDIDDPAKEDLVNRYNVNSVPTCVFLRGNGSTMDQQTGLMEEAQFLAKVRELIGAK